MTKQRRDTKLIFFLSKVLSLSFPLPSTSKRKENIKIMPIENISEYFYQPRITFNMEIIDENTVIPINHNLSSSSNLKNGHENNIRKMNTDENQMKNHNQEQEMTKNCKNERQNERITSNCVSSIKIKNIKRTSIGRKCRNRSSLSKIKRSMSANKRRETSTSKRTSKTKISFIQTRESTVEKTRENHDDDHISARDGSHHTQHARCSRLPGQYILAAIAAQRSSKDKSAEIDLPKPKEKKRKQTKIKRTRSSFRLRRDSFPKLFSNTNSVAQKLKRHKHLAKILLASLVAYLIFGGLIFSCLEQPSHVKVCEGSNKMIHEMTVKFVRSRDKFLEVKIGKIQGKNQKQAIKLQETQISEEDGYTNSTEMFEDFIREIFPVLTHKVQNHCLDTAHSEWSFAQSIFYSGGVITTIGYGNKTPKTNLGKIVTIIYAIFGFGLVGAFMQVVSHHIKVFVNNQFDHTAMHALMLRERNKRQRRQKQKQLNNDNSTHLRPPVSSYGSSSIMSDISTASSCQEFRKKLAKERKEKEKAQRAEKDKKNGGRSSTLSNVGRSWIFPTSSILKLKSNYTGLSRKIQLIIFFISFFIIYLLIPAIGFYLVETKMLKQEWTFMDCLYFVIITLSTIGFGDYVPNIEMKQLDHEVPGDSPDLNAANNTGTSVVGTTSSTSILSKLFQNSYQRRLIFNDIICYLYLFTIFCWIFAGLITMKLTLDLIDNVLKDIYSGGKKNITKQLTKARFNHGLNGEGQGWGILKKYYQKSTPLKRALVSAPMLGEVGSVQGPAEVRMDKVSE